jgi:hypothetical protein
MDRKGPWVEFTDVPFRRRKLWAKSTMPVEIEWPVEEVRRYYRMAIGEFTQTIRSLGPA